MASGNRSKSCTAHQVGAFIALLVLVMWGLAVLWIHMVTPAGTDMFAMTYLGSLTLMFLILLPLYWKRVRWAYIGGILIYAIALACAYFSVRSAFSSGA